jgi:hypothetical protein
MSEFQAKQVTRRYVQRLQARPERVFPLLCPVREHDWIESWACEVLHSVSGFAEKGCVFRTRFPGDSSDDVWIITRHEPNRRIEFVRVNALRVMTYSIRLRPEEDGTTSADNEQVLTALNEEGNRFLDAMPDEAFPLEMKRGEAMLNHFLRTGQRLPLGEALARAKASGTASHAK